MERVSHVKFVEILSDKLGISEEETVKKLTEFTIQVKKKAAAGDVVIDGLGTFSLVDNKLAFSPDESFELEVNHSYAGMLPVTIDEPVAVKSEPDKAAKKEAEEAAEGTPTGVKKGKSTTDDLEPVTDDAFEEEEFVDVIGEQDPFEIEDEEPFDLDDDDSAKPTDKKKTGKPEIEAETAADKARLAATAEEDKKKRQKEEESEEAEALVAAVLAKKTAEEETTTKTPSETGETTSDEASKSAADADEKSGKAAAAKPSDTEKKADDTTEQESTPEPVSDDGIKPEWVESSDIAKPGDRSQGNEDADSADKTSDPKKAKAGKTATADSDKKAKPKEIPAYDRNRPDSNTGTIVAILLAALVIIVAALYFFGFIPGAPSTATDPVITEQQAPPAAEQPADVPVPAEATPDLSEREVLAREEAVPDVTAQPDQPTGDRPSDVAITPPATETAQTPQTAMQPLSAVAASAFGLRGGMDTSIMRPYTIVLHSLDNRADAEREAGALNRAGFRSTYFQVQLPTGERRWRVSIGQFASISTAVEASQGLPEPYLSNNFISRIESYNP